MVIVTPNHKEDEHNLGQWLHRQRKKKKEDKLDTDLEKRMTDLGVEFVITVITPTTLEKWLPLLKQYNNREGHGNAPDNHKEDEHNLGRWLSRQRKKKKEDKLDTDLEKRISDLGVKWRQEKNKDKLDTDLEKRMTWDRCYKRLVQYREENRHANVPQRYKPDPELGFWVRMQRLRYKRKTINEDQIKRLIDFGFEWVRKPGRFSTNTTV